MKKTTVFIAGIMIVMQSAGCSANNAKTADSQEAPDAVEVAVEEVEVERPTVEAKKPEVKDTAKYDVIWTTGDGRFNVCVMPDDNFDMAKMKWGIIDSKGNVVQPLVYDWMFEFDNNGRSVMAKDGMQGVVNRNFKVLVPCKYQKVTVYGNYCFAVTDQGVTKILSLPSGREVGRTGKNVCLVNHFDSNTGNGVHDGLIRARDLNTMKFGYVNTSGKVVIPFRYDNCGAFSDSLAPVVINDKLGFIDRTGKVVIKCIYDVPMYDDYDEGELYTFSDGLAPVCRDERWGFVDTTGKLVIPMKYSMVGNFENGKVKAWPGNGGDAVYLNKSGARVGKVPEYVGSVGDSANDPILEADYSRDGEKYYFANRKGRQVIPDFYEWAEPFRFGMALVKIKGKWNVIDRKGNIILKDIAERSWSELRPA